MSFPMPFIIPGGVSSNEMSFFGSNTSSGSSVSFPASILAGDIIIYADNASSYPSAPSAVTPSGFTNIVNESAAPYRAMVSYKLATGSESGSSTGMNGSIHDSKIMAVFRGATAFNSLNIQDVSHSGITASNPSSQLITASGGATPLAVIGIYADVNSSGNVNPRTFTGATADGELNQSTIMYMKYKIYNGSPANITIDMDDEGFSNFLCGFYVEGVV